MAKLEVAGWARNKVKYIKYEIVSIKIARGLLKKVAAYFLLRNPSDSIIADWSSQITNPILKGLISLRHNKQLAACTLPIKK